MLKKLDETNFDYVASTYKKPYIIKFGSKTCGPCNTMKPVLDALCQNNPMTPIFEVDTDDSPEIASIFGIRAVPTIHFCEDREVIYTFKGITPLRDLQYAIDNIDDKVFRETGNFEVAPLKKTYTFEIVFALTIVVFLIAYTLVSLN